MLNIAPQKSTHRLRWFFFSCHFLCSPHVSTPTKSISSRLNSGTNYITNTNSCSENDQEFKAFSSIITKPYQEFAGPLAGASLWLVLEAWENGKSCHSLSAEGKARSSRLWNFQARWERKTMMAVTSQSLFAPLRVKKIKRQGVKCNYFLPKSPIN